MSEDTVKIEVDGHTLEARKGQMLIEVTDQAGIPIPRFCYHKKLSVAANCRMCLVEVERAPKPMPACATPVADGMKVYTDSPKAIDAQKGTMEFLLINHPLDCPICDQGGECELQDVAMGYGSGISRFAERKRVVKDKDIGPLIATEMTRCIHCTRCVRFGDEIAGLREMGATGRGEHMEIGTYIAKSISSELSGNVIDLCPVGALTNKPARYIGRSWEYIQHPYVAPHDCVGSNLYVHTIRNKVMRIVPRDNEAINETWISDRDRFSIHGYDSPERLLHPTVKDQGRVEWSEALATAVSKLKGVIGNYGPDSVGILLSPNATVEEHYLAQKLARGLGIPHIDHRLRQGNCDDKDADPIYPALGQSIESLQSVEAALLVGSNIRMEQPMIGHRLRKAALAGASIHFINGRRFPFQFPVSSQSVATPGEQVQFLTAVAYAVAQQTGATLPENLISLEGQATNGVAESIAEDLLLHERSTVLLGTQAMASVFFPQLRALAVFIAQQTDSPLGYLPDGANSIGAWLAGAVPHRSAGGKVAPTVGLDAQAMLNSPRQAYILLGVEPEFDCWNPSAALAALEQAEVVIHLNPFSSAHARRYADVSLPTTAFVESSGTYVNVEGNWQSFAGACQPLGEARPAWKILRVLANHLKVDGFDYTDSDQVLQEVAAIGKDISADNLIQSTASFEITTAPEGILRSGDVPLYRVDGLARRSKALQRSPLTPSAVAQVHPRTAERLGLDAPSVELTHGDSSTVLPLVVDDSVPENCVWVPAGVVGTESLGPLTGPVTLRASRAAA